ncbi:MAG: methylmalonyl Co-A mutase-associated GTPase MeaB [Myxococcota bacterium]
MHALAARVAQGDTAALARACRLVDERVGGYRELLQELFPLSGRARTWGITGAPGVGKSTLTDALIAELRQRGERVGVIAVDPSSPFTGGALLGDRIRMQRHTLDANVFVRSLASRGAHGGLSRSTADTVRLLEAWGANTVLLETVGVGQAEFEFLGVVESAVLVVMPGSGDDVQANKAGILEAADLVVLNKADRPGAEAAESELRLALALSHGDSRSTSVSHHAAVPSARSTEGWQTPVLRTVASHGEGITELVQALDAHRSWLETSEAGRAERALRVRRSVLGFLRDVVNEAVFTQSAALIDELIEQVATRVIDPYEASERLLRELAR